MQKVQNHVIGGITGGIGSALAEILRTEGQRVAGFARNTPSDLSAYEAFTTCNACDSSEVEATFQSFAEQLGSIDSYTHCIGSILLKPAHLTTPEDWHATIRQNLDSAFFTLRVAAKMMSKQGQGSLVFFSTAAAQTGISNHEAIAAAKGGIEALARSAAASYAARGLRVNTIAPSLTNTPLSQTITGNAQALEISKRMHPLGKIGRAEDVASLAAWLHSDQAGFVTGQTFVVDGGISSIVPKPKA
jgi:NAD(P)-dependent dehydrogenase (short-subunit alcohol dehydrogenase family)